MEIFQKHQKYFEKIKKIDEMVSTIEMFNAKTDLRISK